MGEPVLRGGGIDAPGYSEPYATRATALVAARRRNFNRSWLLPPLPPRPQANEAGAEQQQRGGLGDGFRTLPEDSDAEVEVCGNPLNPSGSKVNGIPVRVVSKWKRSRN